MTHQLQAGTYCVFATADECKAAFERAEKLELLHGMAYYKADENMLYVDKHGFIYSCLEANYLDPANKPKQTLFKISPAEFLPRMEGTWEQPIEQLTLPQAIAKLEIEEPYRDGNGREIKEFAVIQIFHFKGVNEQGRGRKNHYMYKWVRLKEWKGKMYWVAQHLTNGQGDYFHLRTIADKETRKIKGTKIVQQ